MNILYDTNVWLDVALNREPFVWFSYTALCESIDSQDDIFITATSLKDVFYICSRTIGVDAAYEALDKILQIAQVSLIDQTVCETAIPLEHPDYEDGILAAAALLNGHECIITRDQSAFTSLEIKCLTPAEFVNLRGYEEIDFPE